MATSFIVSTTHTKMKVLLGERKPKQGIELLLSRLVKMAVVHDAYAIKKVLQDNIPEYTPDLEVLSIV